MGAQEGGDGEGGGVGRAGVDRDLLLDLLRAMIVRMGWNAWYGAASLLGGALLHGLCFELLDVGLYADATLFCLERKLGLHGGDLLGGRHLAGSWGLHAECMRRVRDERGML